MIGRKFTAYLVGGAALVALSLPLTLSTSFAQGAGPAGQGGFGGQGQPGGRGGQGGGIMMGGGPATMVVDGNFLFILRGNQLLKVDKNTLRVVAQGELPMQQFGRGGGEGGRGGDGQGGFGGAGGAGGGGRGGQGGGAGGAGGQGGGGG